MASRLQGYEAKYRALAAKLAEVGFISAGSLVVRETSCGKPGCRCQADPPHRHGPSYQWSRAVGGKTQSRRLDPAQAELYRSWIANRKHLEAIVTEMEELSACAGEILLRQAKGDWSATGSLTWGDGGPKPGREVRNVIPEGPLLVKSVARRVTRCSPCPAHRLTSRHKSPGATR